MKNKGYNKRMNYLLRCKDVIEIVNREYIEGCTTYSGIFKKYVYPKYKMGYRSFMKMVNLKNIDKQIEKLTLND